ncbi:hypothetical protein Tco_1200021, partial [Tanacetum coccineum]
MTNEMQIQKLRDDQKRMKKVFEVMSGSYEQKSNQDRVRKRKLLCHPQQYVCLQAEEIKLESVWKCLADDNFHMPLEEIKVDKTLRFVEEPVEIMDREIKKLKRRKIALVKV